MDPKSRVVPRNILLATDFSPASKAALPHALVLAGHYRSDVYVTHVIHLELMDFLPAEETEPRLLQARRLTEQQLEPLLEAARQKGISCQPLIGEGAVLEVLLEMVHQNVIDLIIVGTHGRQGPGKLLLGSVAEEVFRMAPCSVLTVGPNISEAPAMDMQPRHILYPVEFVPDTSHAADYVVSLAEEFHAKLTFMKVFEEMAASPEEKTQIGEPVRHWLDDHISAESDLRQRTNIQLGFGPAPEAILKFASDHGVDLIVMSVKRLDPVMAAHLPEPDAAYEVVRAACCPVLTVR
jgi:nucleotide-binding universal stress UspA family protein